jgi:hypothetical protein
VVLVLLVAPLLAPGLVVLVALQVRYRLLISQALLAVMLALLAVKLVQVVRQEQQQELVA